MKFEANESTTLILNCLGYQGGTIHQAASETGLTVSQILDLHKTEHQVGLLSDESSGFSSVLTNSLDFNSSTIFPRYQGNINYWFGACRARKHMNSRV